MYNALKEALCQVPEKELKEYFKQEIETPIVNQLKTNSTITADELRVQLIQQQKILNLLLTLRGN